MGDGVGGHGNQTQASGLHGPVTWDFADAPGRLAFTPLSGRPNILADVTADDIGKWALQLDLGSVWRLASIAPNVWVQVINSVGGRSMLTFAAGSVSATGTSPRYLFPWHDDATSQTSENAHVVQTIPYDCSISKLRGKWEGSPDPVAVDFILRKNRSDTVLKFTVDADALEGTNLVDSVSFLAGDDVSFSVVKSASIGATLDNISVAMEVMAE